jgi:hypothetical protein
MLAAEMPVQDLFMSCSVVGTQEGEWRAMPHRAGAIVTGSGHGALREWEETGMG